MMQLPLPPLISYGFTYGKNQNPDEVFVLIKEAGAKVGYHDPMLRKFFIDIPRDKLDKFEDLERKLS